MKVAYFNIYIYIFILNLYTVSNIFNFLISNQQKKYLITKNKNNKWKIKIKIIIILSINREQIQKKKKKNKNKLKKKLK
jgi:hypothetical protein